MVHIQVCFHRVPIRLSEAIFEADTGFSGQLEIGFDNIVIYLDLS